MLKIMSISLYWHLIYVALIKLLCFTLGVSIPAQTFFIFHTVLWLTHKLIEQKTILMMYVHKFNPRVSVVGTTRKR